MGKLLRFLPLIFFVALAAVLYKGLFLNPTEMPSAMIGKKVPEFSLTIVNDDARTVTEKDLKGDIVLLNVWGTWCPSCRVEHSTLLDLAKSNRFKIYGLNYDDERHLAQKWLQQLGDPYQFSMFDDTGKLTVNLGVYAAPETFVIDHNGVIRKRYAGPLSAAVWQKEFADLIAQIEQEKREGV